MTDNTEIEENPWEMENGIPIYRNPVWNNLEHSSFSVDIKHSEFGWIRCSTSSEDNGVAKPLWDARDTLTIQEYEPPEVDLVALKEEKHLELRAQRNRLRQIEFAEFDDDTFQIRQEDQDNMNTFYTDAIAMISGVVTRGSFGIMSATNTLHTLTPEQIIQLAKIMKAKVEEIYARYWYARDVLLANATTKAEIEAIQIPATLNT
jgi:hypothetical protein